jgi:cobalt-zinc-cadmium efflux system outer membrane protein
MIRHMARHALTSIALTGAVASLHAADNASPPTPHQSIVVVESEPAVFTLRQLADHAVARNPALAQAAFRIDAARGRTLQAGLYPNPVLGISGEELGDDQGAPGIWTAPQLTQEIVTGGKLRLARGAASKEVDQAAFELASRKYALLGEVRQAYYDALALQTRIAILDELIDLADKSLQQTRALLNAQLISRLDAVQLEVERERLMADRDAAVQEKPAALRRLAAIVGEPNLSILQLDGSLDDALPTYQLDVARAALGQHPDVHAARVGVDRARLLVERARVEPIPNVTVSAGYMRQSQNRSNDWMIGFSVPIPAFDRNQGNVRAAQADLGSASNEVGRVENSLQEKLAAAFREYGAATQRVERYRKQVLPRAKETYDLSMQAYRGGQFEYLRVLQAQRTMAEARLELVRALAEAWKGASAISALMLEDEWPRRSAAEPTTN